MVRILLILCGVFYAVLCIFSIVTGLMYASGKKELNPLELPDRFMEKHADPEECRSFAIKMGWVTFAVGIAQGITSFALLLGNRMVWYIIALGFTLFSMASVTFKLRGKRSVFAILKAVAYAAVLIVLLLTITKALFWGDGLC